MPEVRQGVVARTREWFGVDADWERVPADPARAYRHDLALGGLLVLAALVGTELARSIGYFEDDRAPVWLLYLLSAAGAAPLAWRRRYPLIVLAVVYTHFLVVGAAMPLIAILAPLQIVYFIALFTAVAWARDRRAMLIVVGAAVLVMFGWIVWQFAVGAGVQGVVEQMGMAEERPGLVSPVIAMVAYTWLVNEAYFFGAILAGQLMWHGARRREQLADQAGTIERQAAELQRQAVVSERLRIARELHDVVAHHVSVIGIQAAAARRLLTAEGGDPAVAGGPLATIEAESREAVTQMRGLVGTLRAVDEEADAPAGRAPEPGLADIPALAGIDGGLDVEIRLVEEPAGVSADVPGPLGLSLYRTAQEALSNVRRHSTAHRASVVVRVDRRPPPGGATQQFRHGYAEVEVLDAGRAPPGAGGGRGGLLGLRERVATHGGVAEVGPRATGGYRVRVRLPLPEACP
jgi:signal transduction histidine kinase